MSDLPFWVNLVLVGFAGFGAGAGAMVTYYLAGHVRRVLRTRDGDRDS